MKSQEFSDYVEQLHSHMQTAAAAFFEERGIEFNGVEYARYASTDLEMTVRELLMFGGNLWVESDETVEA